MKNVVNFDLTFDVLYRDIDPGAHCRDCRQKSISKRMCSLNKGCLVHYVKLNFIVKHTIQQFQVILYVVAIVKLKCHVF